MLPFNPPAGVTRPSNLLLDGLAVLVTVGCN
jgi:hypothetical protein